MPIEIISVIIWTIVFSAVVKKANKNLGKIDNKIYKYHIFFAWFLLISNHTGFRMLGWALGHPGEFTQHCYIPVGPLPAWFILISWFGSLVVSIGAIVLAFFLVKRKEKARSIFIIFFPFLYFFFFTETLKGFYKGFKGDVALWIAILLIAIVISIQLLPMYFFYKNKKTKRIIFNE